MNPQQNLESVVREIRRKARKKYSSEEKIRIVLDCLKGEESIAKICRSYFLFSYIDAKIEYMQCR